MTHDLRKLTYVLIALLLVYVIVLEGRIMFLSHELSTLLEVEQIDMDILTIHTQALNALHNRLALSESTIYESHRPLECEKGSECPWIDFSE